MGNISDFYYRILNIGSSDIDVVDVINKVISDFMTEYGITYDSVGFCKVVASVLNERFKEFGLDSIILNTKELFNLCEHEVVLVRNLEDDKLRYYLVDLTFRQFLNNGGVLRDFFEDYPADKLTGLGKEELAFSNDLLKYGYSEVNIDLLSSYFSYFMNKQDEIRIEDMDKFFINCSISKF